MICQAIWCRERAWGGGRYCQLCAFLRCVLCLVLLLGMWLSLTFLQGCVQVVCREPQVHRGQSVLRESLYCSDRSDVELTTRKGEHDEQ